MITIQSPNMLIVDTTNIYTQDLNGQLLLDKAPTLTFEYKNIRYYAGEQLYSIDGTNFVGLSEEQQDEIEQFILSKRNEVGILKLAVDSNGKYLGRVNVNDIRIESTIDLPPPNQDAHWRWNFELNKWMPKYFYDAEGTLVTEDSDKKVGSTFVAHPNKPCFSFDTESQTWLKTLKKTTHSIEELQMYKEQQIQILLRHCFHLLSQNIDLTIIYDKLNEIDPESPYNKIIAAIIPSIECADDIQTIDNMVSLANDAMTPLSNRQ